ncbi:MAG: signal recognition particle receptor subunit alpha, partial [Brevundimonas sp.]
MTDAPKKGWLSRLTEGLSRSSRQMTDQVVSAFVKEPLGEAALEGLEEHLLESDLGPAATDRIVARFRELRFGPNPSEMEVKTALAEAVADELSGHQATYEPLAGPKPFVTLFVGVNGSGKTTTLGKIAADLTGRGAKVMIVAGDTFRAAAREQLKVWAERAGAHFESRRDGADAAGLAYDAFVKAKAEGFDVVLIDTAGRLQNKSALM